MGDGSKAGDMGLCCSVTGGASGMATVLLALESVVGSLIWEGICQPAHFLLDSCWTKCSGSGWPRNLQHQGELIMNG